MIVLKNDILAEIFLIFKKKCFTFAKSFIFLAEIESRSLNKDHILIIYV